MLAREAIHTDIRPLTVEDSVAEARTRMEKNHLDTLPIVESSTGKLIGQITRKRLNSAGEEGQSVASLELDEAVKIFVNQHLFEVARLMLQYELRAVPVVDNEITYRGMVLKQTVLESLSDMLNLAAFGSIVTVKLPQRDFTLSEVVQLIELEGAKILGLTVETPGHDRDIFKVSIKINLEDASRVSASLSRYGYNVETESINERFGFDMEARADEVIKFLDM